MARRKGSKVEVTLSPETAEMIQTIRKYTVNDETVILEVLIGVYCYQIEKAKNFKEPE